MPGANDFFSNLDALRLNPANTALVRTKQVLSLVPVRKPTRQEYIRVHPDPAMSIATAVLEDKVGRETYLVHPAMHAELASEFQPMLLVTAISWQGTLFLWPVPLPDESGQRNAWGETARKAAELAKTKWVCMKSDMGQGAYQIHHPEGDLSEPDWPDKPLPELLEIAFRNRVIADPDHPFVRRLRGLV